MKDLKKILTNVAENTISKDNALDMIKDIKRNGNSATTQNQVEEASSIDNSFSRIFEYNEPYLKDHTVFGDQVILGVTHCSLAIDAFKSKFENREMNHIHRMLFLNPILLKENEKANVTVEIQQKGDKISFKNIYQINDNSDILPTAQGEYKKTELPEQPKINISEIKDSADKKIAGSTIYGKQSADSIMHGPSLKTVKNVYFKDKEILGELQLSEEIIKSSFDYKIHPALFDGSIVSATSFLSEEESEESFVPFMIKEVYIYNDISSKCFCHSQVVTHNKEVLICDIKLCDEKGNVLVFVKGFTCKRVDSADIFGDNSVKEETSTKEVNKEKVQVSQTPAPAATSFTSNSADLDTIIEEYILSKLTEIMGSSNKAVNKTQNFMDMGIDSNRLLELSQNIENEIGIELYPTIFFEQQNVVELTEYFSTEYKDEFSKFSNFSESSNATSEVTANQQIDATVTTSAVQPTTDVKTGIEQYVFEKLKDLLGSSSKITKTQNFMDMGADSNRLLELSQSIENEIGIELYPTIFFEQQNVEELTDYFYEEYEDKFSDYLKLDNTTVQPTANQNSEQQSATQSNDHFEALKNKIINNQSTVNVSTNINTNTSMVNSSGDSEAFTEDIAIIGMGGIFAESPDVNSFWKNLRDKKDLIKEIPMDHFDYRPWYDPTPKTKDKLYCKWGSFVDDVDKFDAQFFRISPREAEVMDPQLRKLLQVLYNTAEDAGYPHKIKGSKTGVYVGVCFYDYENEIHQRRIPVGPYDGTGNATTMYANRPSFYFDLKGPSLAVDTACSSSLVALHSACRGLQHNECEMAFVSGINLLLGSWHYRYFSSIGALSETGRCHTFDKKADGYVPGDAVASILLKPLSKAIRDNDRIHAVIKGSAINHGGYTPSITAPSAKQEAEVILDAWKDAKVDPETISYIEAHGTGTKLGDPIEINAVKSAFKKFTKKENFCAIGSAKAHIGHAEGAAGVVGVIKSVLSMQNKQIPVMPKFEGLNPYISLDKSPLYINTELKQWDKIGDSPRRAGISSFGFGGAYAHVVVEEYEKNQITELNNNNAPQLLVFSAKDKDRLQDNVSAILKYIDEDVKNVQIEYHVDSEKLEELIKNDISNVISSILSINSAEIDCDENFEDYGVEQIHFNDIINMANEKYGISLTLANFTEYTTVNNITKYILETYQDELVKCYPDCNVEKKVEGSKNSKFNFSDFVYTLQVGREQMEERLAFTAKNLEEVTEKLTQYVNGEENIPQMYTGNIEEENTLSDFIADGKSGEKYVEALLAEHEYEKLAKIWTAGVELDWSKFYQGYAQKPIIMSMPNYQFAKESYWAFDNAEKYREKSTHVGEQLHPLVQNNISNLMQQKYATTFTGNEFYLSDHVLAGQSILPGVAYIEMARAAGELAAERQVQKVKNIVWSQPIMVTDQAVPVQIKLMPEQNQDVAFEINNEVANKKDVFCKGKIEYVKNANFINQENTLDVDAIKSRCNTRKEGEYYYDKIGQVQLNLGKSFQVIEYAHFNDKEVIAKLKLPGHLLSDLPNFKMIPVLLDGSFQSIVSLVSDDTDSAHIPFTLDEIEIYDSLKEDCYTYVSIASQKSNTNVIKYNIIMTDKDGKVLVRMKNYFPRPVKLDNKSSNTTKVKNENTDANIGKLLFKPELLVQPLVESANNKFEGNYLVFENENLISNRISKLVNKDQSNLINVISVKPEKEFKKLSDNQYQVKIKDEKSFNKLLTELKNENKLPGRIIYNLSIDSFSIDENISKFSEITINPIFHFTKAVLNEKPSGKVEILNVYHTKGENAEPHNGAVSGFAKSVNQESKKIYFKNIEFNNLGRNKTNVNKICDIILSEFNNQKSDNIDIKYSNDERYIKTFKEFNFDENVKENNLIKKDGAYVITGGAGGLGLLFAEYLAKNYKTNLILTGRSKLNSNKQSKIDSLKSFGSKVDYLQSDLTKLDDVHEVVKWTKDKYKSIDGIIHCAGVIKDSFIVKKSFEQFNSVIEPKLIGTANLDKATEKENLDFFMMFSSISGAVGNIGQSDYAYGNAFLDNFSTWRNLQVKNNKRQGKTISINWPLWKNGGMQVDEQTEKYLFQTKGITLLSDTDGTDAFEKGLMSNESQFVILVGDKNKVRKTMISSENNNAENTNIEKVSNKAVEKTVSQSHETQVVQESSPSNNILSELQKDLTKMVSEIVRIDVNKISANKDMSEYGLDSIALSEFANSMNSTFELDLTPAVFFEFESPSINALSSYLIEEYSEIMEKHYNVKSTPVATNNEQAKPVVAQQAAVSFESNRFGTTFENVETVNNEASTRVNEPIAIIGMHGSLPGSESLDSFWESLINEKDLISEIPADRWDWKSIYGDPMTEKNKTNIKWGGFINDIDKFDSRFFNISPKEAQMMDPQQRIYLETVWKTIEDAGYKSSDLSGTNTGLFVGVSNADYMLTVRENGLNIEGHTAPGTAHCLVANRISYILNLHGPSEPVDTACSSALIAINRAVESIQSGNCDMAIAGGVNVLLNPMLYLSFSKAGMLSPDGKCKTFDKSANGYARGEGVGAILLKPLSKAIADGDNIHAVVKSAAVNHGGRANSLTAPNASAQAELLVNAYKKAGFDPSTVSYIEAHGTGTSLGDPVEINGLKKAFKELYSINDIEINDDKTCAIGSVKSNIGHLESAAGIAGVMKVLLAMKNKKIPATINFKEQNPYISLTKTPFYIANKTQEWETVKDEFGQAVPRRAGVSSFGFGGANAHVVLEEYQQVKFDNYSNEKQIILLSAKNEDRLNEYVANFKDYILKAQASSENALTDGDLANIAYTLQVGRDSMDERVAFYVNDLNELIGTVDKFIQGSKSAENIYYNNVSKNNNSNAVFIEGRAGQEFIRILISDGEIEKLLQLWISGVDIDWSMLYQNKKMQRMSLPTYPFEKVSHWLDLGDKSYSAVLKEQTKQDKPKQSKKQSKNVKNDIEEIILNIILDKTGIPTDEIENDKHLSEYGVDSITQMTIASAIMNSIDSLDNDEDGDQIVQCYSVNEIVEYIQNKENNEKSKTTKSAPQKAKKEKIVKAKFISDQVKNKKAKNVELDKINFDLVENAKENIMCENIQLFTEKPLCISGILKVDESHKFFFDHPLDHVSGMHLTEAMNECVKTAGVYSNTAENEKYFISKVNLSFDNFCLKDEEAKVWISSNSKDDSNNYKAEIIQSEKKVISGSYSLKTYDPSKSSKFNNNSEKLVSREACSQKIVNKQDPKNVLISKVYTNENNNSLVCWLLPSGKDGYFNSFKGETIDNLQLLEACRQSFRLFGKHLQETGEVKVFDNKNIMGILKSQKLELKRPIYKNEDVCLKKVNVNVEEIGKNKVLNVNGEIVVNKKNVGDYNVQVVLLNNELYKDMRGDGVVAAYNS